MEIPRLITILGPTAVGKTRLAALLSDRLDGEIISADSRQVYRGMTIGTGKDLDDYVINRKTINFHIIDVAHPSGEFNVFQFKKLFVMAAEDILSRQKQPVLCGGTGLYLDAVLRDYYFVEVPQNDKLRSELEGYSTEELALMLQKMKKVHNKTDLLDRERLYRAIEIQVFHSNMQIEPEQIKICNSGVFGIYLPLSDIRQRIKIRLSERLNQGMVEEVQNLIASGISTQRLISFGLEYKFVTLYLLGNISKDTMFEELFISIGQFAKRQMSWFRRMERMGVKIHWIDGAMEQEKRVEEVMNQLRKAN